LTTFWASCGGGGWSHLEACLLEELLQLVGVLDRPVRVVVVDPIALRVLGGGLNGTAANGTA